MVLRFYLDLSRVSLRAAVGLLPGALSIAGFYSLCGLYDLMSLLLLVRPLGLMLTCCFLCVCIRTVVFLAELFCFRGMRGQSLRGQCFRILILYDLSHFPPVSGFPLGRFYCIKRANSNQLKKFKYVINGSNTQYDLSGP